MGLYLPVSKSSRIRDLPSYDEPYSSEKLRLANDDEILIQMFAVESLLPEYCSRISPNSFTPYEQGIPAKYALRNDCFFSIAQETNMSALCARIGANAVGDLFSRQRCETQLGPLYKDTKWRPGPARFLEMGQFVRTLQKLGYPSPFLSQGREIDWNDFYSYLQSRAPKEERLGFLRRAKALPSYTD
jgi:hypothetical protein